MPSLKIVMPISLRLIYLWLSWVALAEFFNPFPGYKPSFSMNLHLQGLGMAQAFASATNGNCHRLSSDEVKQLQQPRLLHSLFLVEISVRV